MHYFHSYNSHSWLSKLTWRKVFQTVKYCPYAMLNLPSPSGAPARGWNWDNMINSMPMSKTDTCRKCARSPWKLLQSMSYFDVGQRHFVSYCLSNNAWNSSINLHALFDYIINFINFIYDQNEIHLLWSLRNLLSQTFNIQNFWFCNLLCVEHFETK